MRGLARATAVELFKAHRSRVPLLTVLASLLAPFGGVLFMIILKNPDLTHRLGIISVKAQVVAGTADGPSYIGYLAQRIAIAGILLFGFVATWVFGREYTDRTIYNLLALPTSRSTIAAAKLIVTGLWSIFLTVVMSVVTLILVVLIGLLPVAGPVFREGMIPVAVFC